jgi:hypothetical protein
MNEITVETLPELIRKRMPNPRELSHIEPLGTSAVTFVWHQRKCAVNIKLEVFELKDGKVLLVTGASQLIQSVLRTVVMHQRVVEDVIQLLASAEELLRSQKDMGLQKTAEAKKLLARLIG